MQTKRYFVVYSEDWLTAYATNNIEAAKAYRYQEFGYAGYILEYDKDGNEVASHS